MSSILREDQYFDNEADFCVVWNEDSKAEIEQIFLDHRISYFVKEEPKPWYRKLLSFKRYPDAYVIRINSRDIARAAQLVEGIEDVEITGRIPQRAGAAAGRGRGAAAECAGGKGGARGVAGRCCARG